MNTSTWLKTRKTLFFISTLLISISSQGQYQGFENWTPKSILDLEEYETTITQTGFIGASTVQKVTDNVSGNYSVKLETVLSPQGDTIFGFLLSGDPDTQTPGQPITLTGAVDSIIGWYKYDIVPGDSATLLCETYSASIQTGGGTNYITGQELSWKRFAYPLSATGADSMILAAATGDPLNGFNGIAGSWIQLDDIQIKGASGTMDVLNSSFENWTSLNWEDPNDWSTANPYAIGEPLLPAVKTSDNASGSFALQLNTIENQNGDTIVGIATNGELNENGAIGGVTYTSNPIKLEFQYKNILSGVDSSWVNIVFSNGGTLVGNYGGFLNPAPNYTLFSQNINLIMLPDTLRIIVFSGKNPGTTLFIDDIDFIFPVGVSENLAVEQIVSFPNPAVNKLNIRFNLAASNDVNIRLLDLSGKELLYKNLGILNKGIYNESFNTTQFNSGVYFIEFTIGKEKIVDRFMIK